MIELLKDSPKHVKYSMARHWVMGVALEHHIRANKELKDLHDCMCYIVRRRMVSVLKTDFRPSDI